MPSLLRLVPVVALSISLLVFIPSGNADDSFTVLDDTFDRYEASIQAFVVALNTQDWEGMPSLAAQLTRQSEVIVGLGSRLGNDAWSSYASNLVHHCEELELAVGRKDGVESLYLAATLINHIGEIQSSHPVWLRHFVLLQLQKLEEGLRQRDPHAVRDAAEAIHTSANKIVLSVGSSPGLYRHTYWKRGIIVVNRLGDGIIGGINDGDWSGIPGQVTRIRVAVEKWTESFKDKADGNEP
ncbi:MAG: hypothetical protein HQL59_13855 [Magnetococcales bacterium]|nr:hypothetical protein [Magnetococcales bacterium]